MVDNIKYVRIICYECDPNGAEKFLTREVYNQQMRDANRGWRCPDCHCYPCDFDDNYWEKNEGISEDD